MIEVIKGRDNIKFIKLIDDIDEALGIIGSNPDDNILWLEFRNINFQLVESLLCHKLINQVKKVRFGDNSDYIWCFAELSHWTSLSFSFDDSIFDFSNQNSLIQLGGVWSKKWTGLNGCIRLQSYHVSGFRGEIESIPNISNLLELVLIQPKLKSLNGINLAASLEELEITMARNLVDISQLSSSNKNVKKLIIDSCKKILSYEEISKLEKLQYLAVLSSGSINSVKFLCSHAYLEFLNLYGTKLIDASSIDLLTDKVVVHGIKKISDRQR